MVEILKRRNLLKKVIREYFYKLDFLEVDTPILSPYENPDDNVKNAKASFCDFSGKKYCWFLQTSPEFFMKRLLLKGAERIFQISKVFRSGEITDLHSVEFTMVEWYRVGDDYRKGIEETISLIRECGKALKTRYGVFKNIKTDLYKEEFITVDEAFREFTGVSVFDKEKIKHLAGEKEYETAFFKLLVEKVEPEIAKIGRIVVLYDYPKEFGAFSKVKGKISERFEIYISGVELANGYTELTTFEEYATKFTNSGKTIDKTFLKLLKRKSLPQCEGVALGFDRLLMVLIGANNIREVIPYSTGTLIQETNL